MNHAQSGDTTGDSGERILQPQRNCRELCDAERVAVLRETADYFDAFARACRNARRQILILGWDFDRHERLYRDDEDRELPDKLGDFLKTLVRQRPQLEVYLLTWDFSMIYAAERELLPALRMRLSAPRRLHFRLDGEHPPGASQHQKVVVIDDRLAFVGGVDLSRWRWDTGEHKPDDPRRMDPDGKPYPPFHDLMFMVQGPVAARLGELARERWRRSSGRRLPAPPAGTTDPWPGNYEAELRNVQVAIARTEPAHQGRAEVREVERLYLDAIAAAERRVYIENQYFTSHALTGALAGRLAEERGPDVVLVLPKQTGGWLEQVTMDVLRGREVARLRAADRHDRLRIYYPHQPGLGDTCISVHAKLLIVDDRLLRIGSSNTSNRSMGLDTECDLALEAVGADADQTRAYIDRLRRGLLAEHLDCDPEQVARAESEHGRLIAAIESLRDDRGRSLRPLDTEVSAELDALVPDAGVLDPDEPVNPEYFLTEYVPEEGRPAGQRRLLVFSG
ncbi:MAG: phospholipase D-like domain-containing protein [Halioglobus sp.]|nr:phospholipase D-like domain-containing protein [Halioglobus sp.]